MSNKAYGIYSGCIHEGGGCGNVIYLDIKKARKECLKLVRDENKSLVEMNEMAKEDGYKHSFKLYKEKRPNYWQSDHDCISIQEFDVV